MLLPADAGHAVDVVIRVADARFDGLEFDEAMSKLALAYADQANHDYAALKLQ